MRKKCFENTYDRILVIKEYPLFLMATLYTHKLEQSQWPHNKLILYLADGYFAYTTSEVIRKKPVESSECMLRFGQTQCFQYWQIYVKEIFLMYSISIINHWLDRVHKLKITVIITNIQPCTCVCCPKLSFHISMKLIRRLADESK